MKRLLERARGINPLAVDAMLALVFTGAALWTLTSRVTDDGEYRDDDVLGIVLVLLQTLPLAVRSIVPLAALSVSVAAISLHIAIGYEGVPAGTFAALVILYSAASISNTRQALFAALVAAIGIAIYFTTDRGEPGATAAVSTYATYAAAWGLGMFVRSRRQYTSLLEERADLLEREREVQAQAAVADERTRIARELHDIVGHALNVVVIQAGGAQRVFESKPEVARDSLASIESTGRQALTDMERMLGVLRESERDDVTLSPQPGLGDVETLVGRVREAGLSVEVTIEGTRTLLPPSVDLSAYRIIQEALTNTLKHATEAHAAVNIRYGPRAVELEIIDDGRSLLISDDAPRDGTGGRGLIGMKERVTMFGGEFSAGPRPQGGFRVHARLPTESLGA